MTMTSVGDLARGLMLKTRSAEIRSDVERLSKELSSGRVSDVSAHLAGDYSHVTDIERGMSRLDAFRISGTEARLFADAMQAGLTRVADRSSGLSTVLLQADSAGMAGQHGILATEARGALEDMISSLNTRVGGRSVFAGVATDSTPLPQADILLARLKEALEGAGSARDAIEKAQDWFQDPAGFATLYGGSDTALSAMQVSERETVALDLTVMDPALRDGLMAAAVAALNDDPALSLSMEQRGVLARELGVALANTGDKVIGLQGKVGAAQDRIGQAAARNAAARSSLEIARNELIGADPYDTATRLQAAQGQLDALYSVTVRNAQLSLVNYLK
ncbi:flagellin [Lutimaribacter marinistellae]|uniref:Flagellin n=1 Tax=Lutimaribacter marinistellae TaxID=1820329 RepID=A0ABV7TAR4_9RHOB